MSRFILMSFMTSL